jgi:hypothetical protein
MPYALFSNDAKLSKTYPTEADVWKVARKSGLVIDVVSEEAKAAKLFDRVVEDALADPAGGHRVVPHEPGRRRA